MNSWHVWTINPQRYKKAEEFLSNITEIDTYIYPTVVKEYSTKTGWKKKDIPLYSNYIFIKYKHTNHIHSRLENCLWIKDYLGVCSQQEIMQIKKLSEQKYEDIMPGTEIKENHSYKLTGTPFKGMICTVVDINGEKLTVSVELFGSARLIKCSIYDINVEG